MSKKLYIEVFKPTTDNWSSNIYINRSLKQDDNISVTSLVQIILKELLIGDFAYQPKFRITVSGIGFISMLHDFDTESDARDCFMNIIQLKLVNFRDLEKLNFLKIGK